jgi:hypothetical protein
MNFGFFNKTPKSIDYETTLINYFNDFNQKYPNINNGGCGTFSYHLSNILSKYGINNEIVYKEEINVPENAYRCDVKFEHILVKTDKCVIDNNGTYKLSLIEKEDLKPLKKKKLKQMISDNRLWNDMFNHEIDKNNLIKDIYKIEL